jgi:hypothetical protein
MPELVPNTQGEERPELLVVSDLRHIPAPSDATWLGEWHPFECDCCGDEDWQRIFGGRSWTVETNFPDPVEVELAGFQFSDGTVEMWIHMDGDFHNLTADQAVKLSATLSWAAKELERTEGGIR